MINEVIEGDCEELLISLKNKEYFKGIHLTFLDPPFNQGKAYNKHIDNMPEEEYWNWMERVTKKIYDITIDGGAIYFMQREKNTEYVLRTLRNSGWRFQNLIIWNKLTSAIPSKIRFSKKYQVIAFCTKGDKPLSFNNLRYEPPLLAMHEYERETGMYLTDIWDDIRELTSGYFAGGEAIRTKDKKKFTKDGERFHKQQSPIELLIRIILNSSNVDDFVLDPFAGTGVTAIVAKQLKRNSISIEIDPLNVEAINTRLKLMRNDDDVSRFFSTYIYSENLDKIWSGNKKFIDTKLENYFFKEIPKNKLNNILLMKETIKNLIIWELKIPEDLIKFDYRLKDKENKVHRFELVTHINKQSKVIFRLIYAKNLKQAEFWKNRIGFEYEIIKEKEPNSYYIVVLSGLAFKNIIKDINNELKLVITPFPGWEKIYGLKTISEIFNLLDIKNKMIVEKQFSLDNF